MTDVEVVVVGGGVMGLATAWRLAEAGREVAVLERFEPMHGRGSSHGATRIFRFAYDDPAYVRMAQAALPLWRDLEAGREEILRTTGGVDFGNLATLERIRAALEACGARAELLDAYERRRRFPWLDAGDEAAVWSPDTGVVGADRARAALADRIRAAGGEVRSRDPVERIERAGDGVAVVSAAGTVRARSCVVAAGAWVGALLEPLGLGFPHRVTREQVVFFRGEHAENATPFIQHDGRWGFYGVTAFAGAPGYKVAQHLAGAETTGDARSFEPDPDGLATVVAYARARLPWVDPEPVAVETCLYTVTPDEHFVIDREGPVVVGSPCSGHGFKFAPIVGEALARLATGRAPPFPVERFARARLA